MDIKLRQELLDFRDYRGWRKLHTGPNIAHALMVEAAELNRLFEWGGQPTSEVDLINLREEIADIAIYLEYLLDLYKIDINKAVSEKIMKNAIKYPVVNEW